MLVPQPWLPLITTTRVCCDALVKMRVTSDTCSYGPFRAVGCRPRESAVRAATPVTELLADPKGDVFALSVQTVYRAGRGCG